VTARREARARARATPLAGVVVSAGRPLDDDDDKRAREHRRRLDAELVAMCGGVYVPDAAPRRLRNTPWETLPRIGEGVGLVKWRRYRQHLCVVRECQGLTLGSTAYVASVDDTPLVPPRLANGSGQISTERPHLCLHESQARALAERTAACFDGDEFPEGDEWFVAAGAVPSEKSSDNE
jgi:hypothetical protein